MTSPAYRDNLDHLADELRLLDLLIARRLATIDRQTEAAAGFCITRQEVDRLLADRPAASAEDGAASDELAAEIDERARRSLAEGVGLALPVLGQLFGLSALEQRAVVVCLAPELRRKYDRLYAYLQDDITRQRPSVDLVLELLCLEERQRWSARAAFSPAAPLRRAGLLHTVDDPQSPSGSSGLAQFLALDPRIRQFLLDADDLDAGLAGRIRLSLPGDPEAESLADPELTDRLVRLADHRMTRDSGRRALVCYLHGPAGAGKWALAARVSHRLGVALLSLDATGLADQDDGLLRAAFREGLLRRAAVHLSGAELLPATRPALVEAIADFGWLVFLTGESAWTGPAELASTAVQPVAVPPPDLARSTDLWRQSLTGHTAHAEVWATELAARFRLPPARIRAAVRLADDHRVMAPENRALTMPDVSAACRQLADRTLGELAVLVRPRRTWGDLVLPPDKVAQLRDICDQVHHRHQVFDSWGFGARLRHGRGLSALFTGPPGTGKTLAAEVLATELDLDLCTVDLSGVVSKYIGETEKNLSRVFAEARTGNAILFFDEADALFGKRTEVSDAHDRYANIETSYLLQKMEEHEGVVVLATNLRQNMDDAFVRRIRFIVDFPFPQADSRQRIWQTLIPPDAPVASDVDLPALAAEFPVAGGNIRNIVLNAAFLAAADGGVIDRRHILHGTRREFEKIGKLWREPATVEGVSR